MKNTFPLTALMHPVTWEISAFRRALSKTPCEHLLKLAQCHNGESCQYRELCKKRQHNHRSSRTLCQNLVQ